MYSKDEIKKVAIYCASSTKIRPIFFEAADRLGRLFATNGLHMIYGAGNMGLMGKMADALIEEGGTMTGVIPQFMVEQGWHHPKCTELIVTEDMANRKTWIWQHADALVALPGGIGTLDELSEILVLKQLGVLTHPIVILNTDGYYDALLVALDKMVEEHFLLPLHQDMYKVVREPEDVLPAILDSERWTAENRKHAKI